jgi:hypothetical protein
MGTRTIAATLCAVVTSGALPGHGATGPEQEITLFPKPKPPYSELFKVPPPETTVKPPQPFTVEGMVTEVPTPEPRSFTPRIVCGMKMIESDADLDSRIVMPIPERHGAKIRVLGPPPCDEVAAGHQHMIIKGGTFGPVVIDRR